VTLPLSFIHLPLRTWTQRKMLAAMNMLDVEQSTQAARLTVIQCQLGIKTHQAQQTTREFIIF